jgi:hypothetical protein
MHCGLTLLIVATIFLIAGISRHLLCAAAACRSF